jgi:hypothetical protein
VHPNAFYLGKSRFFKLKPSDDDSDGFAPRDGYRRKTDL